MSHITDVKLRIKDLTALAEAAPLLGLEFREGQTTHKWYGRFVGDTTPPAGLAQKDYGKCLHALALTGDPSAYEIGVVAALDGGEGYDLVVDSWQRGRLLAAAGGPQMNRLRQEYAVAVASARARKTLTRKGFVLTRQNLPTGRIQLALRRR